MRLLTWVWDIDIQVFAEPKAAFGRAIWWPLLTNAGNKPVIRTLAMSSDTNPAGDIFGGWPQRCVTVAVHGMVFHTSAHVVDEVSVYANPISRARTSMTFRVEA